MLLLLRQSHSLRLCTMIHVHRAVAHPPVRCRDLGSLSEAGQATGAVSPTLLTLHPWHQMARPRVERRSPQESQPAQHKSTSCFRCICTGLATSQGWKTYACSKQSFSASSKKESAVVVLQESVTKISCLSLHRRESAISHGSRTPQTETAGAHQ